jgi:hypothetical protein
VVLESIFEALEMIFEVEFEFLDFFGWVWPEMKKVARNGLVRNGGSWLGHPSPMSAVAGEVRENWRRRRKKKKKKPGVCVR